MVPDRLAILRFYPNSALGLTAGAVKSLFLIPGFVAALSIGAQAAPESTSIPSSLPIYVNGRSIAPHDGGHTIAIDRTQGVLVDGVVYLAVTKTPPFVEPVKTDGMHYVVHIGMLAATAELASGGTRDDAKQSMIARWREEFGDEVTWTQNPSDKYQLTITYHEQSLRMTVPQDTEYHPEKQPPDNFEGLKLQYRELVAVLQAGALVLCGQTYMQVIAPADAAQALKELRSLPSQPKTLTMVGGEPVFATVQLVGDKYVLTNSIVRDLTAHR